MKAYFAKKILSTVRTGLVTSSCLCKNLEDAVTPIFIEAVEDRENNAIHTLHVDKADHGARPASHLDKAGSEEFAPFELCGSSCDLSKTAESLKNETLRYELCPTLSK